MDNQCTATAKSTGERCQRPAIKGGSVCYQHGGAASQVQQKAQERLDEMADTTTATIQEQITDLEAEYQAADETEEKLALMSEMRRLWKIILDRTGHGKTETKEHTGENGGGIVIDLGDE
ncbi:hypothetical protein OSG_eHP20_00080 [environmental Halophage eHP-20]|nr:hypothetical protein OSG_eHP20_00080 [environmental Halophage eHP-20]